MRDDPTTPGLAQVACSSLNLVRYYGEPLALGLEPGGQSRASLAIVVIGGLISSLVLTLFIVPIMYSWLAPKTLKAETKFADEARPTEPPHMGTPSPA